MKRLLILFPLLFLLVACGETEYEKDLSESKERLEEAKKETERLEEVSKEIDKTSDLLKETSKSMGIEEKLNEEEIKILLEYAALSAGDTVEDLSIENDEIYVVVGIGESDSFDDKSLLAETVYSRAGDELLLLDGWNILTIDFIDIGEVSMNRIDAESNDYGEYFSLDEIAKQLEN